MKWFIHIFQAVPLLLAPSRHRWKANPFWLIPVVVVASMARGMTLAPRIQVYTDIACRAVQEPLSHLSDECTSLPEVQQGAASLQASIMTVMSILSAITTGPWSKLGDSVGRKPIIFASLMGALSLDIVFVFVTTENSFFSAYAEQLLMFGFVLDGAVGGLSSFNGVVHAYMADCTEHGSRSKIFSTMQGIVFIGLALGPWGGGIALSVFKDDPYLLFRISAGLLITLLCYLVFICPESLEKDRRIINSDNLRSIPKISLLSLRRAATKLSAALLSPIAIFTPRTVLGSARRDYNLTFLGVGLFIYLVSIGIYQIKYLYAKHIYSWTSSELGFYMSLLWISRAINLLGFIPIIVAYLKPKPGSPNFSIYSEMHFDQRLAQCSLAVDGLADALVAVSGSSSPAVFTALSCINSFTSGGNPAMHSLGAVCLHASGTSAEAGALFGAMAVLSAVAHAISPTIYAVTYGQTVAYFPRAIFCLAAALLGTTVLLLGLIKSQDPGNAYAPVRTSVEEGGEEEEAL
ncbi:major facilitator superfamily domain-containing protein [Mucidula mucida]|nr:major facilitator superfamily domain-containing protein [Mucidula mucida]